MAGVSRWRTPLPFAAVVAVVVSGRPNVEKDVEVSVWCDWNLRSFRGDCGDAGPAGTKDGRLVSGEGFEAMMPAQGSKRLTLCLETEVRGHVQESRIGHRMRC